MENRDTDVVVVGAGVTGLMLAAELRLAGIAVAVLERRPAALRPVRALGFSARTTEEFDQRGLLSSFGAPETIPVGHFGGLPLDFRCVEGAFFGTRGIPQPVTERILGEWAAGLGADVRRGVEVVALRDHGDGVEVGTDAGPLRARYVVGCDGVGSTVRGLAGIDFPGTAATAEVWLADVTGLRPRPRFSGVRVPGGWVTVLPTGPTTSRLLLHERGAAGTGRPPGYPRFCAAWTRLTGEDVSAGRPLWTSSYTDESRLAARYRHGRVFLAGDAAHTHLPIHGQGMSGGIQDAVNLGWKLAAAVRGTVDLLDTYESERRPVAARILADTLAQRYLWLGGDALAPLRDLLAELLGLDAVRRTLVGLVSGLDIRYDVGPARHPLLGRRLPRLDLVGADSAKTTTFELLHAGRGVLLDLAGDPAVRAAAGPWADRVDVVTAAPHEPGTALDGLAAVLVRPDGHLAWIATADAEAATRARGASASSASSASSSASAASATASAAEVAAAGDPHDLPTALTRWFGPPS